MNAQLEPRPIEVLAPTTVQLLQSAELDQQIATAKKYPRSIEEFYRRARTLATMNPQIAESLTYVLKRDSKKITGPSARFAEVIASQWGNCRYGARVVAEDGDFVTAQGVFHDLESNSQVTFEVKRRIVDKNGQRYSVDMVGVTANAACSIALRNAVFKGVPKAIWEPVHAEAVRVARGDVATLTTRRTDMLEKFKTLGVKPEELYAVLEVKGLADIGLDEMVELGGIYTAITDGDATVEQVFRGGRRAPAADESLNASLGIADEPKAPEPNVPPPKPIAGFDEARSEALLRGCKSRKALQSAMLTIKQHLGGAETPLRLSAAYTEMNETLE